MNKNHIGFVVAGALALVAGVFWGPQVIHSGSSPTDFVGHANWIDQSANTAELTASADLIVQARVLKRKNRIHTEVLPVYAEDGVTVTENRQMRTAFTDVKFRVIDTLKGSSGPIIKVLQTGGVVRDDQTGQDRNFAVEDDPLFEVGTEHMLFLHNIAGDGIHSNGRKLYRVVNPLGRLEILPGGSLQSPRSLTMDVGEELDIPVSEDALRFEVQQALSPQ